MAQLSFIGDMVFTTPLLDALKEAWPETRVVVVGSNTWFLDRMWQSRQTVAGRGVLTNPGNPELFDATWLAESQVWTEDARANLAALAAAGAPLVPASDGGYAWVPPGWGLHRELAELEALGWSRQDVLTAATDTAATGRSVATIVVEVKSVTASSSVTVRPTV